MITALSTDCELMWMSSAELPLTGRQVTAIEQLDESGAAWITGWALLPFPASWKVQYLALPCLALLALWLAYPQAELHPDSTAPYE